MTTLAELGPHDWQDYAHYWREADAEWLQSRSLLRVDTYANLPATVPTPGTGQTVYVKDAGYVKDTLFLYAFDKDSNGTNIAGWKRYSPFPQYLHASPDTSSLVTIGHHTGNGTIVPTLSFSPTGLTVVSDLVVRGTTGSLDVLKVTKDEVRITTLGTNTAILKTDANGLYSDRVVRAPGFKITGAVGAGVIDTTSLTATSLTVTGATILGAVNAASVVTTGAHSASAYTAATGAAGGFKADKGQFWGTTTGAVIRRTDWQAGWPQLSVLSNLINFSGGATQMDNQFQVLTNRPIEYWNAANSALVGYGGPVIVSATEPTTSPNGTIWVQP
jgi:hypothetical protein